MPAKKPAVAAYRHLGKHYTAVNGVSVTADGRVLSASMGRHQGERGQVLLWDGKTNGALLGEFGTSSGVVCWYAEMSPDGDTVAAGFGDCSLRLWSVAKKTVTTLAKLDGIVASLSWSADGNYLFAGNCGDSTVRLFDVPTQAIVASGKTKKSATWMVALSADGSRGVSGSADKLVHVWSAREGKETAALAGHTGKILGLAFFPDGRRVASASQDKTARLWDLDRGAEIAVLDGHKKQVSSVAVSSDGARIATLSLDTIRVWEAASAKLVTTLSLGDKRSESLAFSPAGDEVITGCQDGDIIAISVGG
jgi:WD40 repeat protein